MLKSLQILLFCLALQAHEIGTSRVSVTFANGAYAIEVVTDATALAEKLEAYADRELKPNATASELQALLAGSLDTFRQRVALTFDGKSVHPEIAHSVEPPDDANSAAAATIRLTGKIPEGAKQFTWRYGWTFASYAMTVHAGSDPVTFWLDGNDTSAPISVSAPVDRLSTARRYLLLGFTHIVPYGLDHMLFVLGIYLLSRRVRSVLWQVSAFTVAHSITLGLSMYGLIHVSPRIVEPMIAISIAYVAIENIFLAELKSWRVALVFAFGLLHGMGFAGVLQELGLPRSEFVTALLSFNVGVEVAQLAVIAGAFVLVGWQWSQRAWYRARVVVPASAAIACTAVYWTVERVM